MRRIAINSKMCRIGFARNRASRKIPLRIKFFKHRADVLLIGHTELLVLYMIVPTSTRVNFNKVEKILILLLLLLTVLIITSSKLVITLCVYCLQSILLNINIIIIQ
jgi:hypothetical protein